MKALKGASGTAKRARVVKAKAGGRKSAKSQAKGKLPKPRPRRPRKKRLRAR